MLPYLLLGNLRFANKALLIFTSQLSRENQALVAQDVSSKTAETHVFPSLPLLNFLGLLLLAIQRGTPDLFRTLTRHYATHIKEIGIWDDALAQIGERFFGIRIPRQGNPLFDMMGSMLFGGGGGAGGTGSGGAKSKKKSVEAAPAAPELD